MASLIHETALEAFRTRTLIRLPFDGGEASLVTTTTLEARTRNAPPADVARLIDEIWESDGADKYDGQLIGVTGFSKSGPIVTLECGTTRYRDYLATDRILAEFPECQLPLAVGVHALLLSDDDVVFLRLQNGRMALPGGAVDAKDLAVAGCDALQHGLSREVVEETGIEIAKDGLAATGLYVGGFPTHLIAMFLAEVPVEARKALESFSPADDHDRVRSVGLRPLSRLIAEMRELPLVMRAAVRSLLHYKEERPASIIEG